MRGGFWIVASCGIAALALNVGSAQDSPSEGTQSSARAEQGTSSRFFSRGMSGKPAADKATDRDRRSRRFPIHKPTPPGGRAGSPSFLDELFNRDASPSPARAKPSAGMDLPRTTNRARRDRDVRPVGHSQVSRQAASVSRQPLKRDPQVIFPTYGGQPSARGKLSNADLKRDAARPRVNVVRPVRATSDNISPFTAADEELPAEAEQDANPPKKNIRRLPLPDLDSDDFDIDAAAAADDKSPEVTATTEQVTETPGKTTVSLPPADSAPPASAVASGPQTPALTIHWVKQGEMNVGQECRCQLHVTNSGKVTARNVAVNAFFPPSVRLIKTTPTPAASGNSVTWKFDQLAAGQEQVIDIHLIPSQRGDLATTAYVTFTAAAGNVFRVSEPMLAVTVAGPREIHIGDPASQIIKVSNPGTGVATNVKLEAIVPDGLEHQRGERLAMEIGSLNPGETRVVRLALASVEGGEQVLNVQVAADGDLRSSEAKTISVVAPMLTARITGPALRYVGRAGEFTVTVSNDSDVASNNVRAVYKVPTGYKFVRADNGGSHEASRDTVSWFVGRLEPGQSAQRTVLLSAVETGSYRHLAAVTSEHGASTSAELEATVDATASLAVQIVEREGAVEVGTETAFEVRVQNDGSKTAENVGLSIELPAGVKYKSARGPSEHLAENGLLVFKSIERLEPGKTAVYRVFVQGTSTGQHRLRARVASKSISQPLIAEEIWNFTAE